MPFRSKELDPLRQMAEAAILRQQQLEREELQAVYDWYALSCPCGLPLGDCETHPRARPKQRPPGTPGSPWPADRPWSVFLMQAGRGGGKTRAAAEFVRWKIETGQWKEVIIIGATIGEVIKYQVQGPSGLEKIAPPWSPAKYYASRSMVYYPAQDARVYLATSEEPDSLRGGNIDGAWCVAEGELVTTRRGLVPINDVLVGDQVWTRKGWKIVLMSGMTGENEPVFRITASTGESVRVTANHKVFTRNRGWVPCSKLFPGDIIVTWKHKIRSRSGSSRLLSRVLRPGLNGKACGGIGRKRDTTWIAREDSSMLRSGSSSTATAYRTATVFITETTTRATMPREIWSCSPRQSILASTISHEPTITSGSKTRRPRRSARGSRPCGRDGSLVRSSVRPARRRFSRRECGPSSVPGPVARTSTVVSVVPDGRARVYDLTVDGCSEFVVSSILVHNSDELGKWKYQENTWHQVEWVLRNKTTPPPQNVVSTTSTASPIMDELNEQADREDETPGSTGVIRVEWDTEENRNHLDPTWLARRVEQWRGTLLGLQELSGKHLRRKEGALWSPDDFGWKGFRILDLPELEYVGVGVDPQAAAPKGAVLTPRGKVSGKRSTMAETGIVVAGREPRQRGSYVSRGVVLDDRTLSGTPGEWGRAVVRAYHDWQANEVVAEKNQGGEMVRHVIETVPAEGGYPSGRNVPIRLVYAAQGKTARAEPIQAIYEVKRVRHYAGPRSQGIDALEQQMVQYMPGKSGQLLDRVDALVWILYRAIIEHDGGGQDGPVASGLSRKTFQQLGYDRPW